MKRPVVVKLGTSLVVGPRGGTRPSILKARAREIAELMRGGVPVCVVSSGAVGLGLARLGTIDRPPQSVPKLQAASALGQARLQAAWDRVLGQEGLMAAQVLLTATDVSERASYVNARNTLNALVQLGAVPVINENDATATDEITFGDNDTLAAYAATLLDARLLVLLTEVEGVYSRAPGEPGAKLIVDGKEVGAAELGRGSARGKGGMQSKIVAAEMAASAGIPTVIASGEGPDVLGPIVAGEPRGTRFGADDRSLSAFKLWLRFAKPVSGRILVDAGAHRAVMEHGKSLLAVGVTACEGRFEPGDGVELAGPEGRTFAKGIASASAQEIGTRRRGLEAVRRNRLVLL